MRPAVIINTSERHRRFITVDADKAEAYIAIVRELAERGPFFDGEYTLTCLTVCGRIFHVHDGGAIHEPTNHEPSCLWRRARELHSG